VLQPTFTEFGINLLMDNLLIRLQVSRKLAPQLPVLPTYCKFLFSIGFHIFQLIIVKPFANITRV
jgi:hypothetical protein